MLFPEHPPYLSGLDSTIVNGDVAAKSLEVGTFAFSLHLPEIVHACFGYGRRQGIPTCYK